MERRLDSGGRSVLGEAAGARGGLFSGSKRPVLGAPVDLERL